MNEKGISATSLRIILALTFFLVVCLTAGGFYIGYNWLDQYAVEVYKTAPRTFTTKEEDQSIKKLQSEANQYKLVSDKISDMVIPEDDYKNQIMNDLNKYASMSGISAPTYDFSKSDMLSTNGLSSISRPDSKIIIISLNNPVSYSNFIRFLKYIETNLPAIQITGLNITKSNASSDMITIEPITVRAYTHK